MYLLSLFYIAYFLAVVSQYLKCSFSKLLYEREEGLVELKMLLNRIVLCDYICHNFDSFRNLLKICVYARPAAFSTHCGRWHRCSLFC